jgi:hypothetical protein
MQDGNFFPASGFYGGEVMGKLTRPVLVVSATIAWAIAGAPTSAHAASSSSPVNARLEGPALHDTSALTPQDPQKELRYLSKDLKLRKNQRVGVGSILEERAREVRLLLDVESLSQEHRSELATKVMQDSEAQIATLLKNRQRLKFSKVLAKDGQLR